MSTKTTNLGLDKPAISDTPGVTIPQLASNFDLIDSSLADIAIDVLHPPVPLVACKGDGITDDYQAIQNLHDFCFNNNIQKLYFPQPTNFYKITQPLLLKTSSQNVGWWDGKAIKFIGADKATTRIVKTTNNVLSNVNSEVNGVDATILLYDATDGSSGTGIQIKHLSIENQSTNALSYAMTGQACQRMILDDCNFHSVGKGLYFPGMFSSTLNNLLIYCTTEALKVTGNCTSNTFKTIYCNSVQNPYIIYSDYSTIDLLYADNATGTVFELCGLGLKAGVLGTESPKAQYIVKCNYLANAGGIEINSMYLFRQMGDAGSSLDPSNCAIFQGYGKIKANNVNILENNPIVTNSYVYDGVSNIPSALELGNITYYQNYTGTANPKLLMIKTVSDVRALGKFIGDGSMINLRRNEHMPYIGSRDSNLTVQFTFKDKAIYLDNETTTTSSTGEDLQWMNKYNIGDVLLINNPKLQNVLGYVVTDLQGDLTYVRDNRFAPIPIVITGTTAQRPTQNLFIGLQYYDTTLSKPVWWNGSAWKDAMGTTV